MKILAILTRVYLSPEVLAPAIAFYEELFGKSCQLRFSYPAVGLELAQVSSILLIAGTEAALEPYRTTHSTFLVDSLDEFQQHLEQGDTLIISQPKSVPTGRNMRVMHPDGLVVEYVEHAPSAQENADIA